MKQEREGDGKMTGLMKTILLSASILLPAFALLGGTLPDLTLPNGVGVNVHLAIFPGSHDQDLSAIAGAGFRIVREDFLWRAIERQKGVYDWSKYDAFTAGLKRHGLRPYYILDYSNPFYEQDAAAPQHPESIAAFARWAAAAADHFRRRRVIWEIWNEPNTSFWSPRPDAAQYVALALPTARAIRAVDPQACIIAPACSLFDWNFLEAVFKSGLLQYLDAVSVHPYRGEAPETAAPDFARLRELIGRCAPAGKEIPVISGEWGYSTVTRGLSLERQADYIARQQLCNLLNGVSVSIWYDWKNDGDDPLYDEDNFGAVGRDLKPKPACIAIRALTRELSGYRIAQRRDTGDTNDFVLVLTNAAGHSKLAAWTAGQPHSVLLDDGLKLELGPMPRCFRAR